jgi:hypothetical protein
MPEPHNFRTSSELERLGALIESFDGSAPSPEDVEQGLESGIARMMLLEGRLREQISRPSGTPPTEEPRTDRELMEEIRALREAVAEVRARTSRGSAPLAEGFVLRSEP